MVNTVSCSSQGVYCISLFTFFFFFFSHKNSYALVMFSCTETTIMRRFHFAVSSHIGALLGPSDALCLYLKRFAKVLKENINHC